MSESNDKADQEHVAQSASEPFFYAGSVRGKRIFRIREQHVADHIIPLMRGHAVGAAKLDIVLRGIALQEPHAGGREVGTVLPEHHWDALHDLARPARGMGDEPPDLDPSSKVLRLKRKWVGEQLARLEDLNLIMRVNRPGKRPALRVLRDDGTGAPLDDPVGIDGNTYVTILGTIISSGKLAIWGAPALSSYLAAMYAERHDARSRRSTRPTGGGTWYRSARWFADVDGRYGPIARVRLPFSVPTLERGLHQLRDENLIYWRREVTHPGTRRRLAGPRNFYTNRFSELGGDSTTPDPGAAAATD